MKAKIKRSYVHRYAPERAVFGAAKTHERAIYSLQIQKQKVTIWHKCATIDILTGLGFSPSK